MKEKPNLVHRPNRVQRAIQRLAALSVISWLLSHVLHRVDRAIDRVSRGRINVTQVLTGLPVVMLTTIGAKTGQHRMVPLVAIPAGENIILIASYFGNQHHPAWYYNLIAHPEATLADHQFSGQYQAREVLDSERETYWQRAVNVYAGYNAYKRRAKRVIPIVLLIPKR
jgi:deazaflavin-dependent oxidoreductase (nitroreductase family)